MDLEHDGIIEIDQFNAKNNFRHLNYNNSSDFGLVKRSRDVICILHLMAILQEDP